MTKDPQEVILCVLEKIKYKADLTPQESLKETKIRKEVLKRLLKENKEIRESSERQRQRYFALQDGKKVKLFRYDLTNCNIAFGDDLRNVLGVLKEQKNIIDFRFVNDEIGGLHSYYEIVLPKDFDEKYERMKNELEEEITEKAKIRAEEIKKQLEEMNMNIKQEEKEIVKKEIIEETKLQKLLSKDKQEPTPVEIVKPKEFEIKGLEKGLETIANKMRKEDDRPKFPYKLPAGTKWENFIIKFEDDENVFIQVKQFKHNAGYKEMGMVGRGKNPNPSEAWTFMEVLAQVNGELTIKNTEARDKYKKQKELLAKALQSYFSLDYDPFYPYRSSSEKQGNSYKIKITLIPPPDKKEKANANKNNNNDLGIEEEYIRQTPEVYDEYQ